jgi:hypothetical protein
MSLNDLRPAITHQTGDFARTIADLFMRVGTESADATLAANAYDHSVGGYGSERG